MRHNKKINHLGRKTAHRKAMLANMASSLLIHKRISTTVAKAKALRMYVEPLITKSKSDTTTLVGWYLVICRIRKQYLNYSEKFQQKLQIVQEVTPES